MGPELLEAIASAPMFDGLDRVHAESLAAASRAIFIPGGQVLFRRGTPSTGFYVVRNGRMQLSVSNSEGMVRVLEIISPGGAFGHGVMFVREPYPVDATALVDTDLVFVPATAVDAILDEDPAMARLMLSSISKRLQGKIQDIAMLSLQSATQRIVAYVLGAVPEDAAAHGRPTDVALPARKQVLASSLGMTPETFSRAMRTLADKGLITVDGSVLRIPDVAALDAFARSAAVL
ncbi:MAG TPA: Crp/Fnr family transcriptional regulator [Mycobacterium sp.]|nr:Crp/Fnr family transcriptional regulator [Mycobacterium sp.]HQC75797.1 Crp/Fnr family transcriptional regulator [Mycobacterium sp.]